MPPFDPNQTNFTAGALSPRVRGRVDLARYANGAKEARNFIGTPQGPMYRRSGTRHTAEGRDSSNYCRVQAFEFSTIQSYMIEFGDLYCRFFKDNGRILNASQIITGATNASPISITCVAHGYTNGQRVFISGVGGNLAANGEFTVTNVSLNAFDLLGTTGSGAYTSGGTVGSIVELTTTYAVANIRDLFFTQSADTLYITHNLYPPRKLTRSSHTSWSVTTIDFQDGPYLSENTTATTLTFGAATGTGVTVTASATTGINSGDGFKSTDVGRLIRIRSGTATVGWATITGWSSTTVVTVTVKSTVPTAALTTWRLGAWSDTTGYPACSVFHDGRLCFANSTAQPQTAWMSASGEYENMAPTDGAAAVQDNSAIVFTIASNKVNPIFWMESGAVLLLGTQGQEWQVKSGSLSAPITPTNINVTPQTGFGSKKIRARRVGNATLFVQRSGRQVREMLYNFNIDGFQAKDLSLLSEHLLREGGSVVDIAYQQTPESVYWAMLEDGNVAAMLYILEQEVIGWYLQEFGGSFGSGNAVVESADVIPTTDGTSDQLWLVVKRTINGQTKRYIEYLEVPFAPEDEDDKDNAFFVDSGLTYTGAPATTFYAPHLVGETVRILADGAVVPEQVVGALGLITLETAASTVSLGLGYRSLLKTMPPEGGAAYGTAQGKIKRTTRVKVRVLNTLGMKYGPTEDELSDAVFRTMSDPMDASAPLFTGDVDLDLDDPYQTEGSFVIVQDDPLPMTILSLMPEIVVSR